MKSNILKTECLCWLRYTKQLDMVCTEAGYWAADVLGVNPKTSIEIEIKLSKADLLREFINKRSKHFMYSKGSGKDIPNFYYFAVPQSLQSAALEVIEKENKAYGLLVYSYPKARAGEKLIVVKRPIKLHNKPPTGLQRVVARRMASELCRMHITLDEIQTISNEDILDVKNRIIALINDSESQKELLHGTPDDEN